MCSTVAPKNFPYQLPIGQVGANPSQIFASGQVTQPDAGNPANFPNQPPKAPATPRTIFDPYNPNNNVWGGGFLGAASGYPAGGMRKPDSQIRYK
jgi:hypothetical protein